MKRDWDLIREILVAAESAAPGHHIGNEQVAGFDPIIVAGHMQMLGDAG